MDYSISDSDVTKDLELLIELYDVLADGNDSVDLKEQIEIEYEKFTDKDAMGSYFIEMKLQADIEIHSLANEIKELKTKMKTIRAIIELNKEVLLSEMDKQEVDEIQVEDNTLQRVFTYQKIPKLLINSTLE